MFKWALVAVMLRAWPAAAFWGMRGDGIVSNLGGGAIYLTLDACEGGFDSDLIESLRAERIPATIFMTSIWIRRNRSAARRLAADSMFSIQNHGAAHKPASVSGRAAYGIYGTNGPAELSAEIDGGAKSIMSIGAPAPVWYRAGTAFYDGGAIKIISGKGLRIAGFSIVADGGATFGTDIVYKETKRAKAGDIIIAHANKPNSGTRDSLVRALIELRQNGASFARLPQKHDTEKHVLRRYLRRVRRHAPSIRSPRGCGNDRCRSEIPDLTLSAPRDAKKRNILAGRERTGSRRSYGGRENLRRRFWRNRKRAIRLNIVAV